MMGRFNYWMNVSVDLRAEQVPGDNYAIRDVNEASSC
jgi:hypothetical protein